LQGNNENKYKKKKEINIKRKERNAVVKKWIRYL